MNSGLIIATGANLNSNKKVASQNIGKACGNMIEFAASMPDQKWLMTVINPLLEYVEDHIGKINPTASMDLMQYTISTFDLLLESLERNGQKDDAFETLTAGRDVLSECRLIDFDTKAVFKALKSLDSVALKSIRNLCLISEFKNTRRSRKELLKAFGRAEKLLKKVASNDSKKDATNH